MYLKTGCHGFALNWRVSQICNKLEGVTDLDLKGRFTELYLNGGFTDLALKGVFVHGF